MSDNKFISRLTIYYLSGPTAEGIRVYPSPESGSLT